MTRPFYLAYRHGVMRSPDHPHRGCALLPYKGKTPAHRAALEKMAPARATGCQKSIRSADVRDPGVTMYGAGSPVPCDGQNKTTVFTAPSPSGDYTTPCIAAGKRAGPSQSGAGGQSCRLRIGQFARYRGDSRRCTECPNKAYVHIVTVPGGWYRRFRQRDPGRMEWRCPSLRRTCPDSLYSALRREWAAAQDRVMY